MWLSIWKYSWKKFAHVLLFMRTHGRALSLSQTMPLKLYVCRSWCVISEIDSEGQNSNMPLGFAYLGYNYHFTRQPGLSWACATASWVLQLASASRKVNKGNKTSHSERGKKSIPESKMAPWGHWDSYWKVWSWDISTPEMFSLSDCLAFMLRGIQLRESNSSTTISQISRNMFSGFSYLSPNSHTYQKKERKKFSEQKDQFKNDFK